MFKLVLLLVILMPMMSCKISRAPPIRPQANARDMFASIFYQATILRPESPSFESVISPAAIQKLLAVFYNISSYESLRSMGSDLGLYEADAFKRMYFEVMAKRTKARLLLINYNERSVLPYDVLNFFAKDFTELGDDITVRNYFVFSGGYEVAASFQQSAQEYFNIMMLPKDQPIVNILLHNFGIASRALEVYSLVRYSAFLGEEFRELDESTYGHGQFRYATNLQIGRKRMPCKILELPLYTKQSNATSLLLIMAARPFAQLERIIMSIGLRSFKLITKQLQLGTVSIRLPRMKFSTKINLAHYTEQIRWMHLHNLIRKEQSYRGMFNNAFNQRIKIRWFLQSVGLMLQVPHVDTVTVSENLQSARFLNTSQAFDFADNSFLFMVKSQDVIYFMGRHHRKWKNLRFF